MCTLAVYFQVWDEFPIVVAANRDEFLRRPTLGPRLLDEAGIFGGRDERAGGTWFGVTRSGLVAALLNRRSAAAPIPDRRSRGLLCLDALRLASASIARKWASECESASYEPFNLLVADREGAWVASNHTEGIAINDLSPGLHLLTNLDLNDPTCPRIAASVRLFESLLDLPSNAPATSGFRERLREILASHDTTLDPRDDAPGNSLCVHAGAYGTRSSTIVVLERRAGWHYFHADTPPCRGGYQEHRMPWQR